MRDWKRGVSILTCTGLLALACAITPDVLRADDLKAGPNPRDSRDPREKTLGEAYRHSKKKGPKNPAHHQAYEDLVQQRHEQALKAEARAEKESPEKESPEKETEDDSEPLRIPKSAEEARRIRAELKQELQKTQSKEKIEELLGTDAEAEAYAEPAAQKTQPQAAPSPEDQRDLPGTSGTSGTPGKSREIQFPGNKKKTR